MSESFTPNRLTRREFATRTATAIGALAATTSATTAQGADGTAGESDPVAPFSVAQGTKQFAYHNVMNNDAAHIEMPVGVVNGENDGPTLIVTGGLFATEYSGVEAASRLYRDFDPANLSGRLIIIPVITLDAFRFRTPMFKLTSGVSPMARKSSQSRKVPSGSIRCTASSGARAARTRAILPARLVPAVRVFQA